LDDDLTESERNAVLTAEALRGFARAIDRREPLYDASAAKLISLLNGLADLFDSAVIKSAAPDLDTQRALLERAILAIKAISSPPE
jgi:hypothetical protein